jgi:hypothetical protein
LSAGTQELPVRGSVRRMASELRIGEYFAGLFTIGCASGFASRIIHSIEEIGWADAFFRTFGISAIVWFSCGAGLALIVRDRTRGVRSLEIALGAGFVFLVILPIGALSWIAVTGLALYVLLSADVATLRRGASILLAVTVPMFWSPMLFHFFANYILAADALLVSWLLGTHRTGNLVDFADKSGELAIWPLCSSLTNVSLALLCWVTLSQLVSHKKSAYDFLWCLFACAAVVAVNATRMTIMGISQWHYAVFHSEWAEAGANVIILGLIVGICALGVRRELFQRV